MTRAQTVVIGDKIYCGGGDTTAANKCRVFCYSPSQDRWNTLPSCDVQHFGLGQVKGKLATIGGIKRSSGDVTNEVYEFDETTKSWKQSIPSMPTARDWPAVLSYHSTLIVAGGCTGIFYSIYTSVVEVFSEETSQWHTTEPLPFTWLNPSSLLINNRWYLLGGETVENDNSNRVACAHVDLLLQKALPRDQTSTDRDSTNSAWEVLPNTPHFAAAAATFGASLLAVGGTATNTNPPNPLSAVHIYSPLTNEWIHIRDLPAPRVGAAIAMLSPTELLVIGGRNNGRENSVYKGLLSIE